MEFSRDCALVLEGGGLRGVFTAGVLDYFIERGVEFPYVIGVSAGATNAMSYLSKQKGRTLYVDTVLMKEHPYIGLHTFIKKGEFVDSKFLFDELPRDIYPFDWETFSHSSADFEIVAVNGESGEARYFEKATSFDRLAEIGRATSCLPIINRRVIVDGEPMVDGGLVDSIPLKRALDCGYEKAVVVLTQCKGYRKKVSKFNIPKFLCPNYPKVIDLLNSRAGRYNQQLEWIEKLESEGRIVVIRPTEPLKVGRLTTDPKPITELYWQGYNTAKELLYAI